MLNLMQDLNCFARIVFVRLAHARIIAFSYWETSRIKAILRNQARA